MEAGDIGYYRCPRCRGEFFTADQTAGIDQAWLYSMSTYYKAMRDEKETARVARKYGFLRITGREWEEWDAVMRLI
jgi:hypothetical protein